MINVKRRIPLLSLIAGMILGVAITLVLIYESAVSHADPLRRMAPSSTTLALRTADEEQTIKAYKAVNPAVVFIATTTLTVDPYDFFQQVQPREGTGSGIIVDAEHGTILTNLHVIQDASQIEILLADGKTYQARLLGYDEENDVAVLQLRDPPAHLVQLEFADSSRLEVGQRVLAIGNPFGLNRTLTSGIISSLDRTVKGSKEHVMRGLIQTDAAINPGNSGGPLLDMDGRLVGMNTAILSQSGDSAGIGFAVPINQIKRILPELIATGKVLHPKIGWVLEDSDQGPVVRMVAPGSPAAEAGVEPATRLVQNTFVRGYVLDYARADLIVSVNGKRVMTREEVEELVSQNEGNHALVFTLRRGGIRGPERQVSITPVLK